jgi:hypothetical protein
VKYKVESIATNELQRNMIREIEKENRLVKICTYHMATLYLKNIILLIRVGKKNI